MSRNTNAYITFLDNNDWSAFQWSQPATWTDPFWPNGNTSGTISDMFTWGQIDPEMSGLDVFDPAFEQEFNDLSAGSLSGTEEAFWFTTGEQKNVDTKILSDEDAQLLNSIKQSKQNK